MIVPSGSFCEPFVAALLRGELLYQRGYVATPVRWQPAVDRVNFCPFCGASLTRWSRHLAAARIYSCKRRAEETRHRAASDGEVEALVNIVSNVTASEVFLADISVASPAIGVWTLRTLRKSLPRGRWLVEMLHTPVEIWVDVRSTGRSSMRLELTRGDGLAISPVVVARFLPHEPGNHS